MSVRSLDALVVGGGPAALVTAALLGKRGLRGWVVDQGELGDVDPAHFADWSIDDRHAPVLTEIHDALGLQDLMRRRAVPLRPGLRLIGPHERGELEPETKPAPTLARLLGQPLSKLETELRSLERAAGQASSLLGELGSFPPRGFFERRRVQSALQAHAPLMEPATEEISGALTTLLEQLLPFVSFVDGGRSTLARLARPAELLLRGPRLPDGGRPLREVLCERAERGGFEVHRSNLSALEPEGRRWKVEVEGRRESALVGVLIDATQDLSGLDLIPHRVRERKLAELFEAARPAGGLMRAGWAVDSGALPEAMGVSALVLPEREAPWPMWLTLGEPGQNGGRPLRVDVPVHGGALRAGLEGPLEQVEARLRRLFPFFEPSRASGEAPRLRPCFASDLDAETGLGGAPVKTGLRNLFVAGPVVTPGCLAIEGAYLAARQAADAASELLGAKAATAS